jgi:tRNA(Ile)-lysidine synthase
MEVPHAVHLLEESLGRMLATLAPSPVEGTLRLDIAVACSGGRDSMALLHAVARWAAGSSRAASTPAGGAVVLIQVHALHVHHGLSAHADEWLQHVSLWCETQSANGWPVTFGSCRLALDPQPGESIEALARERRYEALAHMAKARRCACVLLAHHQNDQAETFLLQALRGAGPAGLSAMAAQRRWLDVQWCRPWLANTRAQIQCYVEHHRLAFVDDDSNTDERFARNRLRARVMPELQQAFPEAPMLLARSASLAQDAADCLEQLAELDMAQVTDQASGVDAAVLDVARLLALGGARSRNLLRHWLIKHCGVTPTHGLLERLSRQLSPGCSACWQLPGGVSLREYRGRLFWFDRLVGLGGDTPCGPVSLRVRGPGMYSVTSWSGCLVLEPAAGQSGVHLPVEVELTLRSRQGGEQFQRAPNTPPRALKKQFQLAGVPSWQRQGPLVWWGERLLWVPGLGLDARCVQTKVCAQSVTLRWVSDASA